MTFHLLLLPQLQEKYGCHAMMLETVAAVPGMVGGMMLHLKSLRRFEESGGWIRTLLDEAENERMHLMTLIQVLILLPHLPPLLLLLHHLLLQFLYFSSQIDFSRCNTILSQLQSSGIEMGALWVVVQVIKPTAFERLLVLAVQGAFFNCYFILYVLSPQMAHRFCGYLEEEAVESYTHFLNQIIEGTFPNGPAPPIAIDYWQLPQDATMKDVVTMIRADECHHRDLNHFAAVSSLHSAPFSLPFLGFPFLPFPPMKRGMCR
jgi:ubiquinol oxidase